MPRVALFYTLAILRFPTTFPRLASVANFGTDYFLLKIKFLAKREREFTTKFAIAPNVCVCPAYAGHTPKAFQIVQKYKF